MVKVSSEVQVAYNRAREARLRAHAPYSRFQVGAAIKWSGTAEIIVGCNMENASFGATICAERTAIGQAVSRFGAARPEFLVVVTEGAEPSPPCALCLQVLAEFAKDDLPIYLADTTAIRALFTLKDLLPYPFRSFEAAP